jgi:hypothetical protein
MLSFKKLCLKTHIHVKHQALPKLSKNLFAKNPSLRKHELKINHLGDNIKNCLGKFLFFGSSFV